MTAPLTVLGTVVEAAPDPRRTDPMRRYQVRVRVDRVLSGDCDEDELLLLVHSPSLTFAAPDPVGTTYVVTLTEPYRAPYGGGLMVTEPVDPS